MDRIKGECAAYAGYSGVDEILTAAGLEPHVGETIGEFASRIADKPTHEAARYWALSGEQDAQ